MRGRTAERPPLGRRPRRWVDLSLGAKGRLVLALPLSMLIVAAIVLFISVSQTSASQRGIGHARQVTAQIATVQDLVLDGETGIRGYLVHGDERFLGPAQRARDNLGGALDRLGALVASDPAQQDRVQRLHDELGHGYQQAGPAVPSATENTAVVDAWLVRQKASTDTVRGLVVQLSAAENAQLAERRASRDAWINAAQVAAGLAVVLGLFGGLAAMRGFTVGISRRLERLRDETGRLLADRDPEGFDAAAFDSAAFDSGAFDSGQDEIGTLSRDLVEVAASWRASEAEARAATAKAEAADRAKSDFLSRMSHELRTPLNAVLGFAQLLELDLPPDQQDGVRQIRRAGRHLLELINEVLDISRIESGQFALSPEAVQVNELVTETVALMGPIAAASAVRFDVTAPSCSCHVQADRQRLRQILLNLLSNAVKYNQPNGTVFLRCSQPDPTVVQIEVRDTGIGIPEADLPRLFVPFERLGAAATEIEGTGVGLALSQHLARAMGGTIEVTSEVGRGSTFRLVLPVALEPADATLQLPALAGPRRPEQATAARTVLSIEDNRANSRLLEQIVDRRPEWRIVHANLGRAGLDLARAAPPDLILLDLHLPDIRGTEVLRRLKASGPTTGIPVVVLSADATSGQVERSLALGATDYLTKPIDVDAVLGLLDRLAVCPRPVRR